MFEGEENDFVDLYIDEEEYKKIKEEKEKKEKKERK